MSAAYVEEFQRWLEESKNNFSPDQEDESNESDSPMNELESNSIGNTVTVSDADRGRVDESAPSLIDDEENEFYSDGPLCEDEPPVLEPVGAAPKPCANIVPQNNSLVPGPNIPSSVRQYVGRGLIKSKSSGYEAKDHHSIGKVLKRKHSADSQMKSSKDTECVKEILKSKGDENIFDKFSSLAQHDKDNPPPLIPSPEALSNMNNPQSNVKHESGSQPDGSPDFCAMEADSTSELPGKDKDESSCSVSHRLSKNSVSGETLIECDSTCMLGTSPSFTSPASVSHMDVDEVPDQGGGSSSSPEENGNVSFKHHQISSDIDTNLVPNYFSDSSLKDTVEVNECPTLESATDHVHQSADADCPPVLSIITNDSFKSDQYSEKENHTIDNETHSSKSAPVTNISVSNTYSTLPQVEHGHAFSKTIDSSNDYGGGENANRVHRHSVKKSLKLKHRRRHKTSPLVNSIRCASQLSKRWGNYIFYASQVSHLQSRMHRLVGLLFPQICSYLNKVYPESPHFQLLLKDLIAYLQEGVGSQSVNSNLVNQGCFPAPVCERFSGKTNFDCSDSSDIVICSTSSSKSHHISPHPSPMVKELSFDHSLNRAASLKHNHCQNVSDCSLVSGFSLLKDWTDDGSVFKTHKAQISLIPEHEKIQKEQPVVLLEKDPKYVLMEFSQLSCSVLQLILPDITVNLCQELSRHPEDLIHLIDSVILCNSQ